MATELKSGSLWRAVLAELVGMILFIFIGIASAIGNPSGEPDQEVKVALAFGLAIATLAQTLGHISGAHLNPAVTLGLLVSCQISFLKAALYVVVQMLGAVIASGIMYKIRPESSLGLNTLAEDITTAKGFGIEFLATFQLVLCVLATTDKRRTDVTGSAPLAIGLSVGLGHLAAISYTGCGINPARSFGPAVIMKMFKNHWVYWVGPLCGGVVAALLYDFLLYPKKEDYKKRMDVLKGGSESQDTLEQSGLIEGSSSSSSQWPRR
ncbi:aquaporin-1a.2 [Chanos chanos]|uniref:Aquaporin-1a.2 n=1 Tax=Chanos chanos TaxID=29144 RepID=A0A6J2VFE1_CHACN|nr:aquaporin-1-like [Chanos chanos]